MNLDINYIPFAAIWGLLALVVLFLIAYRRIVSGKTDETLHLAEGPAISNQQVVVAHKLDAIDKWGKLLTVVVLVYGLLLALAYTWHIWLSSNTPVGL